MQGILKYTLPEEQEDFEAAQRGSRLLGEIQEFDSYLRSRIKYEELPDEVVQALELTREKLYELIPNIWSF